MVSIETHKQTHIHTYTHTDTSTYNKGRLKLAAREPEIVRKQCDLYYWW